MRARDTDSPIEWTGEAHLVTVSCTECGERVKVPEENAASPEPTTCGDCEHDCLHPTADHLIEQGDDPCLPPEIVPYECRECGERWLFDTETGEHRRDD